MLRSVASPDTTFFSNLRKEKKQISPTFSAISLGRVTFWELLWSLQPILDWPLNLQLNLTCKVSLKKKALHFRELQHGGWRWQQNHNYLDEFGLFQILRPLFQRETIKCRRISLWSKSGECIQVKKRKKTLLLCIRICYKTSPKEI